MNITENLTPEESFSDYLQKKPNQVQRVRAHCVNIESINSGPASKTQKLTPNNLMQREDGDGGVRNMTVLLTDSSDG